VIVDCHTHWGSCYQIATVWTLRNGLPARHTTASTHAVVAPLVGLHDDTLLPRENDDLAAVCAASGGRMIPFCTVNPYRKDTAVAGVPPLRQGAEHAGLKIHPWVQGASAQRRFDGRTVRNGRALEGFLCCFTTARLLLAPVADGPVGPAAPGHDDDFGHCGLFEHWREAVCGHALCGEPLGVACAART